MNGTHALEITVVAGDATAVVTLDFLGGGVVDITTDAVWKNKAAVFAAVESFLRLVGAGGTNPTMTKVWGSKSSAASIARAVLAGQHGKLLTFRRVWAYSDPPRYPDDVVESVDNLSAPVTDMSQFFQRK